MIKIIKRLCRMICIMIVVGTMLFPDKIMAETSDNSCQVVLPVSVTLEGKSGTSGSETFVFKITPQKAGIPVPPKTELELSTEGKTVSGQFEPIVYREPGEYRYLVSQSVGKNVALRYDRKIYEVVIDVLNADNGGLISEVCATEKGTGSKTEKLLFVNRWIRKNTTTVVSHSVRTVKVPKTGDNTPIEILAGILIIAGLTVLAVAVLKKRKKNN